MPRRPVKALHNPIEPLENRVMMSASPSNLNDSVVLDPGISPISNGRPPKGLFDPSTISGYVWLDADRDAERSRSEGGLFNQTVYIDEDNDGVFDDGEKNAVSNPAGYFILRDVEPGTHVIRHVKWEELRASRAAVSEYTVTMTDDEAIGDINFGNRILNPVVIDHLVVYTRSARSAAGGNDAILEQIDMMVSATNASFINSQINAQINLIATRETRYIDENDVITDLERLKRKGEGFLSDIHNLRNEVGADMTTLIVEDPGFIALGVAIFPDPTSSDPGRTGFNVVEREAGLDRLTFTHELGHNLGAGHDTDDGGPFPYSHGTTINVNRNRYGSLMATGPSTARKRLPFFSNPDLTYKGVEMGDPDTADNARTIRQFIDLVAGYRDRDSAGSVRKDAFRFGAIGDGSVAVNKDTVGEIDTVDMYRLTLDEPTHLTTRLFRLNRDAQLQLLQGNKVIESSRKPGQKPERIEANLDAGTYFIRVYHGGGTIGTSYTLKLIGDEVKGNVSSAQQRVASTAEVVSLFGNRQDKDASEDEETALVDLV